MNEKNNKENLDLSEFVLDFDDKDHLIFCEESDLHKRILPFKSAINMRDIGGYTNNEGKKIKWNKIFRGEELSHLSEEDQKEFGKLGITHVFDFREPNRLISRPDIEIEDVEYINYPLLEGFNFHEYDHTNPKEQINFIRSTYDYQVKNKANVMAKPLKILADNEDAVIYAHCTNGKDRTGFFIALLMLLAGIDEEKIISDYTLTNLTVNRALRYMGETMANEVGSPTGTLRNYFGVDPKWLKIQLDYIKENFGTVENYLLSETDLTEEDLNNIKKNILEKE